MKTFSQLFESKNYKFENDSRVFRNYVGKTYEKVLITQDQAVKIIKDFGIEDCIKLCYETMSSYIMGKYPSVYLDLSTGEINSQIKSLSENDLEEGHLIILYKGYPSYIEDIPLDDIMGDLEYPNDCENEREYVESLNDYDERVIDCLLYYNENDFNWEFIEMQLEEIYS